MPNFAATTKEYLDEHVCAHSKDRVWETLYFCGLDPYSSGSGAICVTEIGRWIQVAACNTNQRDDFLQGISTSRSPALRKMSQDTVPDTQRFFLLNGFHLSH